MKIEIKLSNDELICVNNQLQNVYNHSFHQVALYNVVHSIVLDLADSFNTKTKTRIKKSNLFEAKKKNKMTFKYHEAWALKIFLYSEVQTLDPEDHYTRTILNKHIRTLYRSTIKIETNEQFKTTMPA